MPNLRRAPEVHPALHGHARILRLGAEIHDLRQSGYEYEKIAALTNLNVSTCWRYHSVFKRQQERLDNGGRPRHSSGFKD